MNPAGLMVNTVTVSHYTYTNGSDGTFTLNAQTTFTTKASVQPRSSSEGTDFDRQSGKEFAVGYFPLRKQDGTSLELPLKAEVTWGSKVYRVRGPARDVGGRGVFQSVDMEREK